MSEFSELLTHYIHSKDIKTYALAQYCGLDRSNMYKIISGKRNAPSGEIVNRICKFLHLLPAEENELQEAYQIALVGEDNYYRRKEVIKFFSEFSLTQSSFLRRTTPLSNRLNSESVVLLNTRHEINHALSHIIFSELTNTNGHLRFLFQPDYDYLISFLRAKNGSIPKARIDHIICLNNDSRTTHSQKNYNLNCLKQVLPLYGTNPQYNCFYYYDNIADKTDGIAMFPYIVITGKYACLLSPDIQKGYLTSEPSAIDMFKNIFDKYRDRLPQLLSRVNNIFAQLEYMNSLNPTNETGYFFQMTPCLTPYITPEMVEKYIVQELPDRAFFIEKFKEHVQELTLRRKTSGITYIFSLKGVLHFVETGVISEYPSNAYSPLELSDRIYLIRQLQQMSRTDNCKMLKDNIGNIDNELFLFVSNKKGYLMFPSQSGTDLIYLDVTEPGLLFTFLDFCENLSETMFYTAQETNKLLQDVIDSHRN